MIEQQTRNALIPTVAATSTEISSAKYGRTKRLVLEISNLNAPGGDDVFVSVGDEAVINSGRRCQPGQTITWSTSEGYLPPRDRINAFSTNATNLAIYEEVSI
jgi:hypothetical protein